MSTRDLQAKYGGNSQQALRRAIRAELAGGNEALDALEKLHGARGEEGRALALVHMIVSAMEGEIRRRYDMPPKE